VNNEGQLLVSTGSSSKITWLNLKKNTQKTSPSTKLEDCVGYALDPYGRRLVLGDYKSNKLAVPNIRKICRSMKFITLLTF